MAKKGPQMQRRHDDNRRNRRANDKTRLADCKNALAERDNRIAELQAALGIAQYAAQARIASGELTIKFDDRAPVNEAMLPLSRVRQLESEAYDAGVAALAAGFQDFERRWQPVRIHANNILATISVVRGALLFADVRADRRAIEAFMLDQAARLAAHGTELRNLWATLAPDIEPGTLPLQRLVSDVQDGITAFLAGDDKPLRALFDTEDWLETAQRTIEAAGRGPGPVAGNVRPHTAWLRQQVKRLEAQPQYAKWSAGQIANHLKARLLADLRRDGQLPAAQQAALNTLQGSTAANTISAIRREVRALAKVG